MHAVQKFFIYCPATFPTPTFLSATAATPLLRIFTQSSHNPHNDESDVYQQKQRHKNQKFDVSDFMPKGNHTD